MGIKSIMAWKPDADGVIRETKVLESLDADMSTDYFLEHTLMRRSLALDHAELCRFEVMEL